MLRFQCAAAALLVLPAVSSAEVPVEFVAREGARITVDGVLRDWSVELSTLGAGAEVVAGASSWRGPDDARLRFALARDAQSLWIAAEITDDRLVRSPARRATEDAVVLTFAVDGGPVREIALHPGDPGRFASEARWTVGGSGPVRGAEVVEAPAPQGISLEARIPWASLPGVSEGISRLRVRVAYRDVDEGGATSVLASGAGDARSPTALPFSVNALNAGAGAPPTDPLEGFRRERGLTAATPTFDRRVNLGGDARPERAVVWPGVLVVSGPGVNNGAGYLFAELAAREARDLLEVTARDVTADGRADLVLRQRVTVGDVTRELLTVYAVDEQGALRRVLAHEVARTQGSATLRDDVSWPEAGALRVAYARNEGWARERWADGGEAEVIAALTPWGPHRARLYRWNNATRSFAVERVDANAETPAAPASPVAPTAEPAADLSGVLALFRQREGLPASAQPSLRASGDMVEDPTPEQLLVFGRVMVMVGPRFLGGRSFYALQLPMTEADEVRALDVVDVTGDGRGEAVLRIVRNVTTQVRGAQIPSQREMLLVYGVDPARRGRIFAAEVARRVGDDRVENEVALPRGGGREITVRAGRARGWTAETYPFHDAPQERVFPLLLPWESDSQRVVYRWDGTSFSRSP
jgi:hypothetical protein